MDNSKQASSVYDKIAKQYAEAFSESSEYIDKFLVLLPKNAKVLDLGCGAGIDAGYMTSKGFEVIGIDLSKEMLRLAKQKFPKIDFRQQDSRDIDFHANTFEGILAACSLIHITKKDVPALLKKLYQILKKDGTIYVGLQEGKSEEIFIDEPFKPDEKLFLNIMSYDEIKDLLIKTGFTIIEEAQA
ncbi:MAG: methyltransferase domain-containing protein [Nanoarchaeota archaeon]|nr:methyltransferase domain-containing protein [Nanoarchaeota archaeon]